MSRDEQERLRDIKDAIVAIHAHLAHADEAAADNEDLLLHDALLFQFVVIGEAVKHLTPETRESAAEIPWTDVAGLRDLAPIALRARSARCRSTSLPWQLTPTENSH